MTKYTFAVFVLFCACLLGSMGCSAKRPVLYPNAHLDKVGMQVAQADIDACITKAEASGASASSGGEAVGNVATSAAVGAAAGAVFAAVLGRDVGDYALAYGGAAAAGSTIHQVAKSGEPDSVHKSFVNKCLRKKGYEMTGWK